MMKIMNSSGYGLLYRFSCQRTPPQSLDLDRTGDVIFVSMFLVDIHLTLILFESHDDFDVSVELSASRNSRHNW